MRALIDDTQSANKLGVEPFMISKNHSKIHNKKARNKYRGILTRANTVNKRCVFGDWITCINSIKT